MPTSSTDFSTLAGSNIMFTPRHSNTSAAPLLLEIALLPCFAIGTPAPAATKADVVEILKVFVPSPPVPTKST